MTLTEGITTQTPGYPSRHEALSDGTSIRRVELLLIFAFWTFLALLTAANGLLDSRGRGPQPLVPSAPVAIAFVASYLWAVLTPFIFRLSSRFSIERSSLVSRVLLFVGVGILVAMSVEAVVAYLRFEVFFTSPRRYRAFDPLVGVTRLFWLDDLIVYFAVLAAGFARDYFLRFRARQEETIRLQAEAAQLQGQLAEARLSALRTQINPHFLFNTLHAVSTLVERDPRGVRRMIARLSELLRYTLDGVGEQEVPVEQELTFLNRYLEIMQIRFPGLQVHTQVDPSVLDALVPNLILQPLVENAVKHGVSHIHGTGRIEIRGGREGEFVVLSVRDNGPGLSGSEAPGDEGGGLGLRNTRARLAQLYGNFQSLTLRAADGTGLVAEVTLPYHTRSDLRAAGVPAQD
ncbi:MAG: sensor histidine kinase [Gemmatimonadaceae bacterium]